MSGGPVMRTLGVASSGVGNFKPGETADVFPPVAMLTMLRVSEIREKQRREGNFDCFGKAYAGCCDQPLCSYYAECVEISKSMPEFEG